MNEDKQKDLKAAVASPNERCNSPAGRDQCQTPYKRLLNIFQALKKTGLPYGSVTNHPDGRIEVLGVKPNVTDADAEECSESVARLDKAFQ